MSGSILHPESPGAAFDEFLRDPAFSDPLAPPQ